MSISNPEAAKTNQNNSLFLKVLEEPIADQIYSKQSSSTTPNHEKSLTIVSPIDIRPFPKASARKTTKNNRLKLETAILIDSPIKNQLEQEKLMRKIKPTKTKKQNYNTKKTIVPKVPKKKKNINRPTRIGGIFLLGMLRTIFKLTS